MRLTHYSEHPLTLDLTRTYDQQRDTFKPRGLWLSVEGDEPDWHGWREWCVENDYGVETLAHQTRVTLRPDTNVLLLRNVDEMMTFHHRYLLLEHWPAYATIDWPRVVKDYGGIVISPYHWQLRLERDFMWYYSWDCASACVWDLSVIEAVSQEVPQ